MITDIYKREDRPSARLRTLGWFCNKQIKGFRDELSRKEYQLSGLCQECQDRVFGDSEKGIEDDND